MYFPLPLEARHEFLTANNQAPQGFSVLFGRNGRVEPRARQVLGAIFWRRGSIQYARIVGEIGIVGAVAAIANAIYNACGVRLRDLPMTPDKFLPGLAAVADGKQVIWL